MKELLRKILQEKKGGAGAAALVVALVYGGDYLLERYVGLPDRVDQIEQAVQQHSQAIQQFHRQDLRRLQRQANGQQDGEGTSGEEAEP